MTASEFASLLSRCSFIQTCLYLEESAYIGSFIINDLFKLNGNRYHYCIYVRRDGEITHLAVPEIASVHSGPVIELDKYLRLEILEQLLETTKNQEYVLYIPILLDAEHFAPDPEE